jgi:hypothetical protein
VSRTTGRASGLPKYAQVAASVRAQIETGGLSPGAPAPSGAALARITGFSHLTCRKALQLLIKDGVLVPGPSPNARPRVPCPTHDEQTVTDAERVLSMALAGRGSGAERTQSEPSPPFGVSFTTVGHAETGRLWQSRDFWERADKALAANGLLLRHHDDYRAAAVPSVCDPQAESVDAPAVTCITITWGDGTTTTVHPPARTTACHVAVDPGRQVTIPDQAPSCAVRGCEGSGLQDRLL